VSHPQQWAIPPPHELSQPNSSTNFRVPGGYRLHSRLFKLTYIECIGGAQKVHEMMFYALHLLLCGFIGDDICTAEELS
jgi:hypothetical protein